jgi:putative proteasome-type protease
MTYCVAMSLDAGMIFASDSRTNAGVDQIARFSKMKVFAEEGQRVIVTLSSGNLSITQNALNIFEQKSRGGDNQEHLWNAQSLFDVARLLGDSLRDVKTRDGPYLVQNNIDAHANFLIGGQIRGEPPRLFNVYGEGNFIEATPDTCYFQIGETKYGKPIIDRVLKRSTSLLDATKCTVVSFDSTMRSNISVGAAHRPARVRGGFAAHQAAASDRGIRSVFPDGARAMGRGAPAGVRAASRSRLDLGPKVSADGHSRSAIPPHDLSLRPARQPGTARDTAASRTALPHARARLLADGDAGAAFPQLAAGPVRQLGRATGISGAR